MTRAIRNLPILSMAAVMLLSSACQTAPPAMSLEEAKHATVSFSGSSLIPPPRTINDITAVLDQQKIDNPDAAVQARSRAEQPVPKTAEPTVLTEFFYDRGVAALEVGRIEQAIEDLTEAVRWAAVRRSAEAKYGILRGGVYYSIHSKLAIAEILGGNYSRGLEYLRRAIRDVPRDHRSAQIYFYAGLAQAYAGSGDLEAAESAMRESLQLRSEWNSRPNQRPDYIAGRNGSVASAQAAILETKGELAKAEVFWRRSVAAWSGDPIRSKEPSLEHTMAGLANVLRRQGRLLEAENEARAALLGALRKHGRNSPHTARVLTSLTRVLAEQGRHSEAEKLARATIDIYERTGSSSESYNLALARDALGEALVAQSRWQEALVEYEAVRTGLTADSFAFQASFAGNVNWALALLNTGQTGQGCEVLRIALERRNRLLGERHTSTAEVRALIALACSAPGDRSQGLRELAEVVPFLLAGAREDVDDESTTRPARDQQLALILTSYIGLLSDIKGTPVEQDAGVDAAAEAFRLANAARAQSVQRALEASGARASARTEALAELVRQEQDTKKQISALYGLLANVLAAPTDQQDPKAVTALRGRIDGLRRARQRITEHIEKEFPTYSELISPRPATVDQARAALRPGEALIATYVAPDRTLVWAIPQTGPVAFAAVPMGEKSVATAVTTLRKALDPSVATLGEIPLFDVGLAYQLYRTLLEPVRPGWEHAKSLLLVPHGALGQLPFSLLPTKPGELGPEQRGLFDNYRAVPWFIRSHALTVLPSVNSLVTLRAMSPGAPDRRPFVGFGDPYFSQEQARQAAERGAPVLVAAAATRGVSITLRSSPKTQALDTSRLAMLPRLPETGEEIRSLARTLNADLTRDVLLGERANEHVVKTLDLSRYRILAFATHGLVPGDLDGLTQPALALSAPDVAKVEGDGLLTMEEILGLRLNADWVVLSACNTASGSGAGAEAVSGLGRAFFYAGARALLVSNWAVETGSAKTLVTDLFRRQAAEPELSRAEALRQTMLALIDGPGFIDPGSNRTVFSYAHPIFWAPFSLVGEGSGSVKPGS